MSREWKPGDVVTATVKGRESVRLVAGWSKYEPQLRWREMSPRWGDGDDDECWFMPHDVTDHRRLVAIDPEDREAVERLIDSYVDVMHGDDANGTRRGAVLKMQAALREYANPKPTQPDEPQGLGAVVEDEDGARWARARVLPSGDLGAEWVGGTPARWADYEDIKAVRVVVER